MNNFLNTHRATNQFYQSVLDDIPLDRLGLDD
jgi:hypothetical protein